MRDAVEARLEAVVRAHRVTIAVVFPLVGAALLVASAEGLLPAAVRFEPLLILIGVLVMRLPLVAGVLPALNRRGAIGLGLLAAYAYAIEAVGLATGWPYGEFAYGIALGPMIAGVPLALPAFFIPLVLNAYLLALLVLGAAGRRRWIRLPVALGLVLAIDLVLDPAAVSIGFWSYAAPGAYYGVPASNYAGWLLSGFVAVVLVDAAIGPAALRTCLAARPFVLDDLVSFVLLWGAINAAYANWLPVALVALLAGVLVHTGWVARPTDSTGAPDPAPGVTERT